MIIQHNTITMKNIKQQEESNEFLYSFFEKSKLSTIQLFHNDKPEWVKTRPEPIGSGVLFEFNNNYYIVTAAHVVYDYAMKKPRNPYREEDDYDDPSDAYLTLNNIGIVYNQYYYPVQHVKFVYTNEKRLERNIDIAIITIDLDSVKELKESFTFITLNDILTNHNTSIDGIYYTYGYPASWTEIEDKSCLIKHEPFMFITKGVVPNNIKITFDKEDNILISYSKKDIYYTSIEKDIDDFSPNGISGCGLWYYDKNTEPKLVGIMIEDKSIKENAFLMMATKIDIAIGLITRSC